MRYGVLVTLKLITYIFESALNNAEEFVLLIIAYNYEKRKKTLLQMMVCKLIENCDPDEDPYTTYILELLIDLGLPVNQFIDSEFYYGGPEFYSDVLDFEELTPFHLAIECDRMDFVRIFHIL